MSESLMYSKIKLGREKLIIVIVYVAKSAGIVVRVNGKEGGFSSSVYAILLKGGKRTIN